MPNPQRFEGRGLPTLIGSLPFEDHEEAQALVLKYMEEIPIWVQLPKFSHERLLTQFAEHLPGICEEDGTIYFKTDSSSFEAQFLGFFEEYLAVKEGKIPIEESLFALSRERAKGFYVFLEMIKGLGKRPYALKGQLTGPFTLLTGIKDQANRAAYFNPQLREAVTIGIAMKAAFQAKKMLELSDTAIVFLDEPALAGFGSSSMVGISETDLKKDLKTAIEEIHSAGGLCGIHVCANTEWSMLLSKDLDLDIISFDSYGFLDRFIIYKKEVLEFLDRGALVAWGLVPTQDPKAIDNVGVEELLQRFKGAVKGLGIGLKEAVRSSLITPSCGTGLLSRERAERIMDLTKRLSLAVRAMVA